MEKVIKNNAEEFMNAEIVTPFIDGNFLMKIAGENKWYVVDGNGNVVVRGKPDGNYEFSEVDLPAKRSEITSAEFGDFVSGTMMVALGNEKVVDDYFMISPSGYTKRVIGYWTLKEGLNDPRKGWLSWGLSVSPRGFETINSRDLNSLNDVEFYFDIAQYFLVKKFDDLEANRKAFIESGEQKTAKSESDYRRELAKIETSARRIKKRYEELKVLVPRRLERQAQQEEAKKLAKQSVIDSKEAEFEELRQKTRDSLNAMFEPSKD